MEVDMVSIRKYVQPAASSPEKFYETLQAIRRTRNKQLTDAIEGKIPSIYNLEDLMRLVGELNALYNHLVASRASDDPDPFCVWKHLSTAIVLSGEVDGDATALYSLAEEMSGGRIRACQACVDDSAKGGKVQAVVQSL
jgi:hypothetical protein